MSDYYLPDAKVQNAAIKARANVLWVDMEYPRNNPINTVEIHMQCVRAADGVRVSYDFERDGWKIEQASTFSWAAGDTVCDSDWREVAFIQAWGREKPEQA